MSKRKGVSAEEKRTRMLQLFYEKKEFFQLKDLEKIAPKEKGIIANSVKDIVQNLVDDGLVDTDKIGSSIYYWAFPSKAKIAKNEKLQQLKATLDSYSKKLKSSEETLQNLRNDREDSAERNKLLEKVTDLQIEYDQLTKQLKMYQDNDPKVLERKRDETQKLKDAANRWTDNVFSVKTWCKNKFNIEEGVMNKQFKIPSDFDYIN
ncbi:meiotic nuclear division protein 1 homolog isoform X2 [Agrilus planipennis]|nr:meiotic nuclear division protein 1 homolog isoform X2 [Agrilus planipennis]